MLNVVWKYRNQLFWLFWPVYFTHAQSRSRVFESLSAWQSQWACNDKSWNSGNSLIVINSNIASHVKLLLQKLTGLGELWTHSTPDSWCAHFRTHAQSHITLAGISPSWTNRSFLLGLISEANYANRLKRQLHSTNVVAVVGKSTAVLPLHVHGKVDQA